LVIRSRARFCGRVRSRRATAELSRCAEFQRHTSRDWRALVARARRPYRRGGRPFQVSPVHRQMLGKVLCLSAGCEENEVVLVKSKWSATVAIAEILPENAKVARRRHGRVSG